MKATFKNIMICEVPYCDGQGMIWEPRDGGVWCERCECYNKRKSLLALERSGLKENIEEYRFDNYIHDKEYLKIIYNTCVKFIVQDEVSFLYIGGQTGTGKTHIGTATCAHFIDKGIDTIYTTYKMLMNDIKSKVNDAEYANVVRKYGSVEVLYIDDFMKKEPSAADIDHTCEIINMRYSQKKITIITTERSLDEIIQIDEALGGRIKQRCGQFAINIANKPGRNWRLKEAFEKEANELSEGEEK